MEAHYAFGVTIRLVPTDETVTIESPTVERRCLLAAPQPGTDGWLLFRNALWRGEVGDEAFACELFAEKLGYEVEAVDFRAFHADEAYLEAFRAEIARDLEAFRADSVTEVLSKYLGSSIVLEE